MMALLVATCQLTPTAAATPTPLPPVPPDVLLALVLELSTFFSALGRSLRPD